MDDHCTHEEQALRRRTHSNGMLHFVMQCLHCGRQGRAVRHDDALSTGGADALPWDDTIADPYWQRRFAERRQVWAEARSQRRADYDGYLASAAWRARRSARLALDQGRCQARLDGCGGYATEVHHLTYRHCGNEPLFDLVSVCGNCHRQISEMDGAGADAEDADAGAC
ncbi:MAG TPA: hypothetical protein VH475_24000 [Tepidisphaeraceae bacterium]|jgi:hypothetical protein